MHPLMFSVRPTYPRTSVNSVRQRVMSAKLLKLRSIQNQLNDANYHLSVSKITYEYTKTYFCVLGANKRKSNIEKSTKEAG